ncbi:Tat pathway signal sequence domain protein [Streptomyces sp. NPDC001922]|uniref:Tat pathway signal sequence domain protein n=1 Tax=Streptomyces sp. NPDC001922 TaxID=3364624 RepID=UPI00369D1232
MMRRHLGKVVAGAAIAVTGTAVMIGVTLPREAGAAGEPGGLRAEPAADGRGSLAEQGQQGGQAESRVEPGVVEERAPTGEQGTGRDALTDDELERVERLALDRGLRSSSKKADGDTGPQWLSTDLAELRPSEAGAAAPPRRAEVSYYDYRDDTLVLKTVNLTSGKVEDTDTRHGEQPPATRAEAAEAASVLLKSPLSAGLKKDYKDATGKALSDAEQLQTTGMIYRVDEENDGPAALRKCGEHRCMRLFTKVRNGPWIDTRHLVIDLSARTVGRIR